ncbi:MAG: hypothetical protein AAB351_00390 [Patescibacteria group bacterium]
MQFSSFWHNISESISRTNRQLFVLLQAGILLFLYALRDLGIAVALFAAGYFVAKKNQPTGLVLEILSLVYFLFWFMKYNGALGLVYTYLSQGETKILEISSKAERLGWKFFSNSFGAGVILFFGQVLLACPCFLARSNFIFSPFLFVYEDLDWKRARERSKELSRGLAWFVLARTLGLLSIGYILLLVAIVFLISQQLMLGFVLLGLIIYLGLVQSNFIRLFYIEMLEATEEQRNRDIGSRFKVLTAVSLVIVLIIYIVFKVFPH